MARIIAMNEQFWGNWHGTVTGVPIDDRFELHNSSSGNAISRMASAGRAVQHLVGRAFADRRRLRAVGGAWSFSDVAAVPGGRVLSTGFANRLLKIPTGDVDAGYAGDHNGLFLLQAGVSVGEFNMAVEKLGWSLLTSGASNGQTFVGAAATGTHGSAIDQPGIQGHIRALQLIPSPDQNLWIEPASQPVTDGRLAADLGATVVRDDRLFEAVLVGLGAFGVVQSVVVQTAPRFLLTARRERIPLTAGVEAAMRGERYDQLGVLSGDGRPWFFQSVVNSHIDKGHAYVTVMHRQKWDAAHVLNYEQQPKYGPGYNLAVITANLLEKFPGLTSFVTKQVLADQLGARRWEPQSWGEAFNFTTPRGGTVGASVAVPAERALEALAIMEAALKRTGKAPLAFALRYSVKSPGLLAFTRFPRTAIIDTDGLDAPATRRVMEAVMADLRASDIPHAEHWGKINQLTATSVRDAYGADLESWMKARTDLLGRDGEYVFGSAFLDRLGMTNAGW